MGLTRDAVLEMMKDGSNVAGKNYILVDLRIRLMARRPSLFRVSA